MGLSGFTQAVQKNVSSEGAGAAVPPSSLRKALPHGKVCGLSSRRSTPPAVA